MTRRAIDVLVSCVGLTLLFPFLVVVALAIVADSWGSPFYLAPRVGKDGQVFAMWKFRTMVPNAVQAGPVITGSNDSRMTRLGPLLRRLKIDELPQLVNLLLGDVTLVGPRPEAPEIVAFYSDRQRFTLSVKPGITGPDQIARGEESQSIPADADPERYYVDHLLAPKLDKALEYLGDRSLLTDLRIVGLTVLHVPKSLLSRRAQDSFTKF